MSKNVKKYLFALAIILPIGGFFILFQLFADNSIKTAQAVNEAAQAIKIAEAKVTESTEVPIQPIASPDATDATLPAGDGVSSVAANQPPTSAPTEVVSSTNKTELTTAPSCKFPSQILNLASWKETLPAGSSGKPTEIKYASLASYSSDSFFHTNSACNGVVFRAPVNGVTTSGSGYPRSELREMSADGKNLASWSTTSGTHSMFIDEAITAVPKAKKHVVAGQIHDSEDDVIVIRLEYPKLFIDINGKPGPTLDSNYTLGKRFTVKFVATDGQIKVFYNGGASPAYSMKKAGSGNYFKAGAYTQSNCLKEKDCSGSNFGEVVIYDLALQH